MGGTFKIMVWGVGVVCGVGLMVCGGGGGSGLRARWGGGTFRSLGGVGVGGEAPDR